MTIKLTEIAVAYVAGLFDAEGSFHIRKTGKKGITYSSFVDFSQSPSGFGVLTTLKEDFGALVSSVFQQEGNRKPKQVAYWSGDAASAFTKIIRPYFRIKTEQASALIKYQDWIVEKRGRSSTMNWTDQLRAEAKEMYLQIRIYNKKGKPDTEETLAGSSVKQPPD